MKSIARKIMILALLVIVSACAKNQSADGGGGSGVGANPPPNCLPDQNGYFPPGCPVPSAASVNLDGDFMGDPLPLLKDFSGRLVFPLNYYQPYGMFPQFIKCRSQDGFGQIFTGSTCERECKNYRSGAQISVSIKNGHGVVTVSAGPYRAPGLCNRSLNGARYTFDIPVFVESINGNQGFVIRSVTANSNGGVVYNPGTTGWNKLFELEVSDGVLNPSNPNANPTTYNATLTYNFQNLGQVVLYRRH